MKRKAQGAIEYLFMIAAALVIILIVVRQLQNRGNTASTTIESSDKQIGDVLKQMEGGS